MVVELEKQYASSQIEKKWYSWWEEAGFFKPGSNASINNPGLPPYTIVIPPPNVTGILHMGHALNNTIQDILIRWNRMKGRETLWLPGTDHASIATETKVTKMLKEKGIDKRTIGREEFLKHAWQWKEEYSGTIVGQLRRLGCSLDWSRERFTMEEDYTRSVLNVFVKLYEKGYVYRGERIIHWDPVGRTALSDEEVIYKESKGNLWYFKYPIKGSDEFIVVATTRPETMLGDTGIAVNPEDERYQHLLGKTVLLPIVNREIPIFADSYVEKEFGTGCVKVTPAHDPNDFEMGARNNLEIINVMNPDATMADNVPEKYRGLDRYKARKEIVKEFEELGLLDKIEKHLNKVGHSERTDAVVEPYLSKQWFIKMDELAKPALDSANNGELTFHPNRWVNTYKHWMENIRDWCISRQLWWGQRIPVWYRGEEIYCGLDAPEGEGWAQDEDVLDTWFSSWLWPFATLGWPDETEDLKKFYPTSDLVTGPDIIFFWVARMMMAGHEFMEKPPFKNVIIHGIVRAEGGAKMSKSLGNSIDPLEIIEEMGADALRFSMIMLSAQDVYLSRSKFEMGRNFTNKLWNAARFVMMNLEDLEEGTSRLDLDVSTLPIASQWILSKLERKTNEIEQMLTDFYLAQAASEAYHFVWNDYCDWFIELAKPAFQSESKEEKVATQKVLFFVLERICRLLHPFMPFITEEIWQKLKELAKDKEEWAESLMLAKWSASSKTLYSNPQAEKSIDQLQRAVSGIRDVRNKLGIPVTQKLKSVVHYKDDSVEETMKSFDAEMKRLAKLESIDCVSEFQKDKNYFGNLYPDFEVFVSVEGVVDLNKECERLEKKKNEIFGYVNGLNKKLSNEQFVNHAPKDVVEKERQKLKDAEEVLASLENQVSSLKS
jgi:valyl-tRNA synthetase